MPSPSRLIVSVARAGLKAATARLRSVGAAKEYADWPARAAVCERCPLLVRQCNTSYCGKPFLRLPVRDPAVDGCGCPTRAKAKDPAEHCPITPRHLPAFAAASGCGCKWCVATAEALSKTVSLQILTAA